MDVSDIQYVCPHTEVSDESVPGVERGVETLAVGGGEVHEALSSIPHLLWLGVGDLPRKRGFIGGRGMGVKQPNSVSAEVGPSCRVG